MAQRSLDITFALFLLVILSPVFALAAVGIRLSSPGPILYRARRVGRERRRSKGNLMWCRDVPERRRPTYGGREFTLYKFRTMHMGAESAGPPITAHKDARVFRFGGWLRATKIDELPQLINVIKGEMAVVGPRPEDPFIVRTYYTSEDLRTLEMLPGLTSPGTLYYYTHAERRLADNDILDHYVKTVLPTKLMIDRTYMQRRALRDDLLIIVTTALVIGRKVLGRECSPRLENWRGNRERSATAVTRPGRTP